MNNEKLMFKGFGFCYGNKMLILKTDISKRTKTVYNKFIDYMCLLHGIKDTTNSYNENNYNVLRYGVTPILYYDCGSYISIRFDNGQANYPKTDMTEILIFE